MGHFSLLVTYGGCQCRHTHRDTMRHLRDIAVRGTSEIGTFMRIYANNTAPAADQQLNMQQIMHHLFHYSQISQYLPKSYMETDLIIQPHFQHISKSPDLEAWVATFSNGSRRCGNKRPSTTGTAGDHPHPVPDCERSGRCAPQ